jgi:hypothetical protein
MHEVWIINDPQRTNVLCEVCANPQVAMLAPEVAAALAGISLRTIFKMVEAGQVHYLEQADGLLLVCPNSLLQDSEALILHKVLPSA